MSKKDSLPLWVGHGNKVKISDTETTSYFYDLCETIWKDVALMENGYGNLDDILDTVSDDDVQKILVDVGKIYYFQ